VHRKRTGSLLFHSAVILLTLSGSDFLFIAIANAGAGNPAPAGIFQSGIHSEKLAAYRLLNARKAAPNAHSDEARRFAARLKHHQGRQLAKRKQGFRRQQLWIESQRQANKQAKARNKARQFVAARRHAVEHTLKHLAKLAAARNTQGRAHSRRRYGRAESVASPLDSQAGR
jgi:hypothetical protein